MGHLPRDRSTATPNHWQQQVESTLETILGSEPFRNSLQCRKLLQHIVIHTLNGHDDLLKERSIGVRVFGRAPDYDTASDPIVRVRAADVRKRLAQFYQNESLSAEIIRIDVPTGGYHATFRPLKTTVHCSETPAEEARLEEKSGPEAFTTTGYPLLLSNQSHTTSSKRARMWIPFTVGSFLLFTVAGLCWAVLRSDSPSPFEQFWAPAYASTKAIILYNANIPAYGLRCSDNTGTNTNPLISGLLRSTNVLCKPSENLKVSDFILFRNQFITVGDAYATALLSALFARHNKPYQLKFGNELSYTDLRSSPTVLIGAFNNEWTLEMTRELKFVFSNYPSIRERGGRNRFWALPHLDPNVQTTEDYAIVSRAFNPDTGQLLIEAAGITQYGTRAAGEFLTTPDELNVALKFIPSDWVKRNVQFVLHTRVLRDTPGRPTVVASAAW